MNSTIDIYLWYGYVVKMMKRELFEKIKRHIFCSFICSKEWITQALVHFYIPWFDPNPISSPLSQFTYLQTMWFLHKTTLKSLQIPPPQTIPYLPSFLPLSPLPSQQPSPNHQDIYGFLRSSQKHKLTFSVKHKTPPAQSHPPVRNSIPDQPTLFVFLDASPIFIIPVHFLQK